LLFIFAPISERGSMILFMGLLDRDISPVRVAFIGCPEISPDKSLIVVPELPQKIFPSGFFKLPPFTI